MSSEILRSKHILKNSSIAYLFILGIIIFLSVIHFSKFNISRFESKIVKEGYFVGLKKYYCDFNFDGISEVVEFKSTDDKQLCLEISNNNSVLISKYNINGYLINSSSINNILFEDCDNNSQREIYIVWNANDSIFINILEPFTNRIITRKLLIDTLHYHTTRSDVQYNLFYFEDIDNDSIKEFYCSINAGISIQPRNLYLVDINEQKIRKSPHSYAKISKTVIFDYDNDGDNEIITGTYSSNMCPEYYPFSDYYSWLMIYDNQLNFHNTPISFNRDVVNTKTLAVIEKDSTSIIVLHEMRSKPSFGSLQLMNSNLKVVKEMTLPLSKYNCKHSIFSVPEEKKIVLFLSCGKKWFMDYHLNITKEIKNLGDFPLITKGIIIIKGQTKYIFNQPNSNEYFLANNAFKQISRIKIPFLTTGQCNISVQYNKDTTPLIFMQQGENSFWIKYCKNKWYYIQLLLLHGIYIIIILMIWFTIKTIYNQRISEIINEKQLIYFQFQSLKNQLSPHFTFNALNSISNLILTNQNQKAYNLLTSFSKLKRALLENSESNARTLCEEIDFVKEYLNIQEFRFANRFKTVFTIDPEVNLKIPVPKLILQTYVENALKHGLKDIEIGGLITINISKNGKSEVVLSVKDNGVGRVKADQNKESTGKGMKIMEKYYDLFKEHFGYTISTKVFDLYSENKKPIGTEVIVKIIDIRKQLE